MDSIGTAENEDVVDLENGGITSGGDIGNDFRKGNENFKNNLGRTWRGYAGSERNIYGEDALRLSSCSDVSIGDISGGSLDTLPDRWMKEDLKKKLFDERFKKMSVKKASKPPRPPNSPSLDASDMKFVREVSELAMMKRARTERMKILKQKKADKGSSSLGSIFAMLITLIFCYVIVFQGLLGSRV
ncbi:unnamed protein product [Rhodiola kirilowii]